LGGVFYAADAPRLEDRAGAPGRARRGLSVFRRRGRRSTEGERGAAARVQDQLSSRSINYTPTAGVFREVSTRVAPPAAGGCSTFAGNTRQWALY